MKNAGGERERGKKEMHERWRNIEGKQNFHAEHRIQMEKLCCIYRIMLLHMGNLPIFFPFLPPPLLFLSPVDAHIIYLVTFLKMIRVAGVQR